jgi:enoyl-CoA hydratase/carnithine racemase
MNAVQANSTSAESRRGVVDVDLNAATRVAVITFGRGRNNYLTYEFVEQLLQALEALHSPQCRAVVLRTGSRHFSAGADFGGERPSRAGGPHIFDLVPRLYNVQLPVVAAIGGTAIGAGLGLALAADFRLATKSSSFMTNFNRIGITPGFGLSLTLPRLIGDQHAAEMFYTARRIWGDEALGFGLCDRLVTEDQLDGEAVALAEAIALSSPRAVAVTRQDLRADLAGRLVATLERERGEQELFIDTDDFREGLRAWSEKRAPNFVHGPAADPQSRG